MGSNPTLSAIFISPLKMHLYTPCYIGATSNRLARWTERQVNLSLGHFPVMAPSLIAPRRGRREKPRQHWIIFKSKTAVDNMEHTGAGHRLVRREFNPALSAIKFIFFGGTASLFANAIQASRFRFHNVAFSVS